MASRFLIQKPYVVATLPQPIDRSTGQYVVAEVYGGAPGAKKRKRSELAVGIDGEGVNLYDVSSSRLITSYALPPQSTFTCPPSSLRTRLSKSKIERRTYVSTTGVQAEVTLFHETTEGIALANSSTTSRKVEKSRSPLVYLGTITANRSSGFASNTSDLLAVKEDGEIQCYDGDSLEEKWTSPASALYREAPSQVMDFKVEFAQLTNAFLASQGILKGRQDILALFPQDVTENGFNPEILVIITRSSEEAATRTLHVVNLPRTSSTVVKGRKYSVESLLSAIIPSQGHPSISKASFSIQVSAGTLQQLTDNVLTTFDLSDTLPRQQTKIHVSGAQSFLRLSSTAAMVSSERSIAVYNPRYQSKLATVPLTPLDSLKRKRGDDEKGLSHTCKFIAYFPKLGAAMAIVDHDLVGVQVESQQDRDGRPRATGLLIDSLGCAVSEHTRPGRESVTNAKNTTLGLASLDSFLPGSIGLGQPWDAKIRELEKLFNSGNISEYEFDRQIEQHFGTDWSERANASKLNGNRETHPLINGNVASQQVPKRRCPPSNVDRRWIIYTLSKIFSWSTSEDREASLAISFYPLNTFMWLASNGYMTAANIVAALRSGGASVEALPPGQLIKALVAIDPDMDLLYAVVANNYLSAPELLHAIRKLMGSLGLLSENPETKQRLLTNGDDMDIEEQVARLQAEAEEDLELAEYQIGPGSGIRGTALSMSLSKLYACPSDDITLALQTIFTSQDIVCLIYLLRFELARGGWTTRYTDANEDDIVDEEAAVEDNAIILIASLLNNCIDAVGTVGWLSGEARLADGDLFEAEELIASLKLEVSAALEGIEEAAYLKGVISELVRYADSYQKNLPQQNPKDAKKLNDAPIILRSTDEEVRALPIGLKAEKQIPLLKIGAGGAIHKRTARDIGFLKSRKVGRYSRERIVV